MITPPPQRVNLTLSKVQLPTTWNTNSFYCGFKQKEKEATNPISLELADVVERKYNLESLQAGECFAQGWLEFTKIEEYRFEIIQGHIKH